MTESPANDSSPRRWLRGGWIFAVLALVALAVPPVLLYWIAVTRKAHLTLASGVELKYRAGLADVLCQEAAARDLEVEFMTGGASSETIQRVDRHELDAAVIPAGLALRGENIRQVTMLDCEALHLFVKPELLPKGVAGLRGKRVWLGPPGSGVRIIAGEVLQFLGLRAGEAYRDESHTYQELLKLVPDAMPDAIFSLSPLPSPLGEKLVRASGYQLLELQLGEALALRKPYYEDVCVPANAYGATPGVPPQPLHTVGLRAMLIAHCDVPKPAIVRLLEVFYDSDFAQRVGTKPLDRVLLQRPGEYPLHAGTTAYLHRHDPWIDDKLMANFEGIGGSLLSFVSAALLGWQWLRRRHGDVGQYLRDCNRLDLAAQRAACEGAFDEGELGACLIELARLKADILERHQKSILAGNKQFLDLVARIEGLQQTLLSLVRTTRPVDRIALAFPPLQHKAA